MGNPAWVLPLALEDRNRMDYEENGKFKFYDLSQLARNKRGRGETKDGALPTLTTSTRLFSKAGLGGVSPAAKPHPPPNLDARLTSAPCCLKRH